MPEPLFAPPASVRACAGADLDENTSAVRAPVRPELKGLLASAPPVRQCCRFPSKAAAPSMSVKRSRSLVASANAVQLSQPALRRRKLPEVWGCSPP